jgi:hypothetical protein
MTEKERRELTKLTQKRERLAKVGVAEQAARVLAEFEAELAATYSLNDPAWKEATAAAAKAVEEAQAAVAAAWKDMGRRAEFAPRFRLDWWDRGENGVKKRRDELRRVAERKVKAMERQAKVSIEAESLRIQERLALGGFETDEAREFLAAMPTPEALMPVLSVREIEAAR